MKLREPRRRTSGEMPCACPATSSSRASRDAMAAALSRTAIRNVDDFSTARNDEIASSSLPSPLCLYASWLPVTFAASPRFDEVA